MESEPTTSTSTVSSEQPNTKSIEEHSETIDIIMSQTGAVDRLYVERVFMECENDITKTILQLMDLTVEESVQKEPTVFDQIRKILNEKDAIYHDVMAKNRVQ